MADISTLGIAVDSSGVRRASDDLDKLAQQGGKTESALSRMVRSAREFGQGFAGGARSALREFTVGTNSVATASTKASSDMSRVTREARAQSQAFGGAASVIRRYAGIVAAAFSAREVIQTADAYTNLSARLLLATGSSEKFATAQAELSRIAHDTRTGIEGTTDLFARLSQSTEALGVSQKDVLGVTQTINQAMAVSGTSAQGAAAALTQLGQAFAAGTLRGKIFLSNF